MNLKRPSLRTAVYWLFTLPVAFEMMAGGVWDLLQIEYVRVIMTHLGYPLFLLTILGFWKIPCALVFLAPRLPIIKEWAYAGAIFVYTGAVASHALAGDPVAKLMAPTILAVLTLSSWALRTSDRTGALRTSDRRLRQPAQATPPSKQSWAFAIAIAAAFLILSFVTLPVGPPPS